MTNRPVVALASRVEFDPFEARIEAVARAAERAARLAAGEPAGMPPSWPSDDDGGQARALATALGLTDAELDLVWSIVARTIDPRVAAHVRAVHGERNGLSVAHHAALCGLAPTAARALLAIADPRHPLRELGLIAPATPTAHVDIDTCWIAPPRLWRYLAGSSEIDPALEAHGGRLEAVRDPVLDARQHAMLGKLESWLAGADLTVVIEGPPGSGRRTAAALAVRPRSIVVVDFARVAPRSALELASALRREVVLLGAVPVFANLDELFDKLAPTDELLLAISTVIDQMRGPVVITCAHPIDIRAERHAVVRASWHVPDVATRRALWADELARTSIVAGELDLVAERYQVGAGGVHAAVRSAREHALHRGTQIEFADVVAGVQDNIAERLGELARRVDVRQDWSDLVLPPETGDDVAALLGRIRHAHTVLEGWGFRSKLPLGAGVAALFSGPPGTGKTMVAGLIARELQLELYQVDLSRIVSKWVGETEKQLAKLFAAAEAGHALLLFDEADALFAKRSAEVKSAVDRYANLEVNYLLQRVESFSGVVILTTNLDASIDPALRRRLASHIVFGLPDTAERARLWHTLLATDAPIARDINHEALAEEFSAMSGANIRNAVLAAAFLAAGESREIAMADLRRAARGEYRAMGYVLGKDHRGGA